MPEYYLEQIDKETGIIVSSLAYETEEAALAGCDTVNHLMECIIFPHNYSFEITKRNKCQQ